VIVPKIIWGSIAYYHFDRNTKTVAKSYASLVTLSAFPMLSDNSYSVRSCPINYPAFITLTDSCGKAIWKDSDLLWVLDFA
jgi:hypothetical protein